jgi:hypothetical protein
VSTADQRPPQPETAPPDGKRIAAPVQITLDRIHVYHDSTAGSTEWSFDVFVDNHSVITLPGTVYRDGTIARPKRTITVRPTASSAQIRIVGTRLKHPVPMSIVGTAVIPVEAAPSFETTVLAMAKSGDPLDGEFLIVFRIQPAMAK